MTKFQKSMSLLLAAVLCAALLTGCRRKNVPDPVVDPTTPPSATPAIQDDTMGTVTYLGDMTIAISEYTTDKTITDFAQLDPKTLTLTGSTEYVVIDDETRYYIANGSDTKEAGKDDLALGDFVIVRTVDGVLKITRIDVQMPEEDAVSPSPAASPDVSPFPSPEA